MSSNRFAVVGALLIYTLIAIAATHPLWLHAASAVPSDIGDPLLNTWILAWDVHALTVSPFGLFQANIFYPLPNTLAFSEHLLGAALTMAPILLATGEPVVAYNVAFVLSFALGGWGAYLLARRLTRCGWAAAFLAGLVFAYAPYRLTAFSHLQLLTFQWLPFALLCLEGGFQPTAPSRHHAERNSESHHIRILKGLSRYKLAVAFIVFLWLQVVSSWHLAVFTGFTVVIYLIGWLFRLERAQRWAGLVRVAVALLAVAILTWPLIPPYLDTAAQLQSARPIEVAAGFAPSPTDYVAAPPWNRTFGPLTAPLAGRRMFTEENFMFSGIIAPVLGLLGLWAAWRRWHHQLQISALSKAEPMRDRAHDLIIALSWLVIALGAGVLSWGPYLRIGGYVAPLPYSLLASLSPVFGLIRVPPRWMIAGALPLAILAAYGARTVLDLCKPVAKKHYVSDVTRRVLFVILAAALVLESWSVPLPLAEVGALTSQPPVYRWLAAQPGDFGIIEWPIHVAPRPEYPETKRLYASTVHWKGLVNGYSGFTPERQRRLDAQLAGFPDERALDMLRDLGRQGVRYLIVHTLEQGFDRATWEETGRWVLERSTTTLPMYEAGGDIVYEINPWGDTWITDPNTIPVGETEGKQRIPAPHPVNARWQGGLVCIAYLTAEASGGVGYVDLFWRRTAPFPRDISVFIHLLDAEGNIIAQGDGPMLAGRFPTLAWSPDEVVRDRHVLVPAEGQTLRFAQSDVNQAQSGADFTQNDADQAQSDADLAQSDTPRHAERNEASQIGVHLRIGLYYPQTGERIPVLGEGDLAIGDYVELSTES